MIRTLLLVPALALAACAGEPADDAAASGPPEGTIAQTPVETFGEPVPAGDILTPAALIADAEAYDGETVTVEGTVREACAKMGCWLTFSDDQGQIVRVMVPRDDEGQYVYTFPLDVPGRTVRLTGDFAMETTSVDDLRHYAEDEGASAEEVAAITEPEQTLMLTATGAEVEVESLDA
ncbi:MAG: DUF4920 domain-containing protein [Bacteroidota bacterium]